jgi:protein-S-isoprenylcysteine O-methyltransferase Ste14
MIKKLLSGVAISSLIVILPVLGNPEILRAPHLWCLILLGIIASVYQPAYNPFTITAKPRDRGTGAQIIWAVYLTQLATILEATYLRYPRSVQWDVVASVALLAACAGLALRSWSVLILGPLFTMHIDVQDGHSLVRRGPYRIVRHPSYLGALVMYLSTIVLCHAWYSLMVAVLLYPVVFLRRIHYEEELLVAEFGDQYEAFRRDVKMILPALW